MIIKIMQEGKGYTYSQIIDYFNKDIETTDKIIKELIKKGIIRKQDKEYKKSNDYEIDIDTDKIEISKEEDKEYIYIFKYVGIILLFDTYFFIYPKYIENIEEDKKNGYKKFKQILKVINKYKNTKEQKQMLYGTLYTDEFHLLPLALEFINDYNDNGIYINYKDVVRENEDGEILWEKTINEQNVYIIEDVPIYLDLYTRDNTIDKDDLFTRLHRCIISELSKRMIDIFEILEIDPVIISSEDIDNFGDKEYLIYRINQELTQQFVTRKQEILKRMIVYINQEGTNLGEEKISLIGTNSFNLIWEDVCSVVMGNSIKKDLSELNLNKGNSNKDIKKLEDIISKPIWKRNKYDNDDSGKKVETLKPDIISINNGKLSIYDAKYYKVDSYDKDNNDIKLNYEANLPGVSDVTKQYLYELAFKDFARIMT